MNRNYVSFHLTPIYVKPEMAKNISPGRSKRRQGKSCCNFTAPDAPLFAELASMTRAGCALYADPQFMNNLVATASPQKIKR
jgi:hypothetical protein